MTSPPGARPDVIALTDAFDIPDRVLNSTLGRALAPAPAVLRDHPAQLVNSPSDLFKARARDLFHRGMQETTLPRARPLDARRSRDPASWCVAGADGNVYEALLSEARKSALNVCADGSANEVPLFVEARLGLGCTLALHYRSSVLLQSRFTNIFGASLSETSMRPDPRRCGPSSTSTCSSRAITACRPPVHVCDHLEVEPLHPCWVHVMPVRFFRMERPRRSPWLP
jgi:hypothetical protein